MKVKPGSYWKRKDRGTRYRVITTTTKHALCAVRQPNGRYSDDPKKYARLGLHTFTSKNRMELVRAA